MRQSSALSCPSPEQERKSSWTCRVPACFGVSCFSAGMFCGSSLHVGPDGHRGSVERIKKVEPRTLVSCAAQSAWYCVWHAGDSPETLSLHVHMRLLKVSEYAKVWQTLHVCWAPRHGFLCSCGFVWVYLCVCVCVYSQVCLQVHMCLCGSQRLTSGVSLNCSLFSEVGSDAEPVALWFG